MVNKTHFYFLWQHQHRYSIVVSFCFRTKYRKPRDHVCQAIKSFLTNIDIVKLWLHGKLRLLNSNMALKRPLRLLGGRVEAVSVY